MTMRERIDYKKVSPEAYNAMLAVESCVRGSGLDHGLLELVKIRVSQINGCAFCLNMHTRDARNAGESGQRLHLLAAWREAPCYSDLERAALGWAEAVTKLCCTAVSDERYTQARLHFDEKALVNLTLAIVAVNGWNRLAVSF
jgi:AhpD family alkylhydroperoxidase